MPEPEQLIEKRDRWLRESGGSIWHRLTSVQERHQIQIRWYTKSGRAPCSLLMVGASYEAVLAALLAHPEAWKDLSYSGAPA